MNENDVSYYQILEHLITIINKGGMTEELDDIINRMFYEIVISIVSNYFNVGDLVYIHDIKKAEKIEDMELTMDYKDSGDCGSSGYSYWVSNKQGIRLWTGNLYNYSNFIYVCTQEEYEQAINPQLIAQQKRKEYKKDIEKLKKEINKLEKEINNIDNLYNE